MLMSIIDHLVKRNVFNVFLKVGREQSSHFSDDGRVFQTLGAETAKARGPKVEQANRGTTMSPEAKDRR